MNEYDMFISHANEDKKEIATPLAHELQKYGLNIWYDDFILKVGDGLNKTINDGLTKSRYGVVILSKPFFKKDWTQKELDGLTTKEVNGKKVILPIWHKVTKDEVAEYSPILANTVAAKSSDGIDKVVEQLISVIDDYITLDFDDIKSIGTSLKNIRNDLIAERAQERGDYWEYTLDFNTPKNVLPYPTMKVVFYKYKSVFPARKRYPEAKSEDQQKVEGWGQRLLVTDICTESYGYTNQGYRPPYKWGLGLVIFRRYNLIMRIEQVYQLDGSMKPTIDEAEKFAKIVDSKIQDKMKIKGIETVY